MKVRQFRYFDDNLGYLVFGDESAIAVDGGAAAEMMAFLEEKGLRLTLVTNTHSHSDHTCGNKTLLERSDAHYIPSQDLVSIGSLSLDREQLQVIGTPGHTRDSVCLLGDGFILSGDTLFNGKVGRCFTGDVKRFFNSIQRLQELPDETVVYGGHDYVVEYMEFARRVEPDNHAIDEYLRQYDPGNVSATLGMERKVDPFLRLEEPTVISFLKERHLPSKTMLRRFASLLNWEGM